MKVKHFTIIMMLCLFLSYGCAATMAAKQPGYTDIDNIRQGTPRMHVLSTLGQPFASEKNKDGDLVEHYQFNQGYKTETRVLRVMFHIAADVFTVFLWEFVGMPIELVNSGEKTTVSATYDTNNQVKEVFVIKK